MTAPAPTATRPPLRRPEHGRQVAGVCAGLAQHLGQPVHVVRWVFVAAALLAGAGVVMYLWLALTVPSGDRPEDSPRLARLVPALRTSAPPGVVGHVALAGVLLLIAITLVAIRTGADVAGTWLVPVVVLLCGAALAWSQLDAIDHGQGPVRTRTGVLVRVGGGVALAIIGILLLIGQGRTAGEMVSTALAVLAVLAGAALVLAPWGLRLWRELLAERAARVREAERADIAAHLHDSVLQTLSLIRARHHEPDTVQRLARAQERELREWLYTDRPRAGDSAAAEIRALAAEVEDLHGGTIEVVTVGDATPDAPTAHLLSATREALVNAVVHAGSPVSLYAEINPGHTEVFVRDRGAGFDPDRIPPDRHGVRDSIVGRMHRHGGRARVRSAPGRGTEIHLQMPGEGGTR